MEQNNLLQNCLSYIFLSAKNGYDMDVNLLKKVIDATFKNEKKRFIGEETNEKITILKDYILELLQTPLETLRDMTAYDYSIRIRMIYQGEENLAELYSLSEYESYNSKQTLSALRRLRKTLEDILLEKSCKTLLSSFYFKIHDNAMKDINVYLDELYDEITHLKTKTIQKEKKGVLGRLRINKDSAEHIGTSLKKAGDLEVCDGKFKTGFMEINKWFDGGMSLGKAYSVMALQENYKSGLTTSLFTHIALFNKPIERKPGKKPLLLGVYYEDSLEDVMFFIAKHIAYSDKSNIADITSMSYEEISKFVVDRLTANGFEIELLRHDPSEWSYKKYSDLIVEYSTKGYDIQGFLLDYLQMMPTTGCDTSTIGSDLRDLYKKMKTLAMEHGFVFITPHQLSGDATTLLRNGIPPDKLVEMVVGKNFYDGSKRLGQEMMWELFVHIANIDGKRVLTVRCGKRKGATTNISPDDLYCWYEFPKSEVLIPIPYDIHTEKNSAKKRNGKDKDNIDDIFN